MALISEAGMEVLNRAIKCPLCEEVTIHFEDMDFFKCPGCGCEIWPEEKSNSPIEGIGEVYWEMVNRPHKKGCGNKGSKGRKKQVKPPVYIARYNI